MGNKFICEINSLTEQLANEPDITVKNLRATCTDENGSRQLRPKLIIFARSETRAQEIRAEYEAIATRYHKSLKIYTDMLGANDVALSEREAKSSVFLKGSDVKEQAKFAIKEFNSSSEEEIAKIDSLQLSEEPIYTLNNRTGKHYTYTYYSYNQNSRVQRSVGDITILYSPLMTDGSPAFSEISFHSSIRKPRSDHFIPNADNCEYYSDFLYIRKKIQRKSEEKSIETPKVPMIVLPKCPNCGSITVIRTSSKTKKMYLTCLSERNMETGVWCPKFNLADYMMYKYEDE